MEIYNQEKTQKLSNIDLAKGHLKDDKIFVAHHEATEEIEEQSHYIIIAEYPNGGKDVEKVIDVEYQPAHDAYDEYEDIKVFIPYTEDELREIEKTKLREWRKQYFAIIDRAVWYDSLSEAEKLETKEFRQKLLDITDTMTKPDVPAFIANQLRGESHE